MHTSWSQMGYREGMVPTHSTHHSKKEERDRDREESVHFQSGYQWGICNGGILLPKQKYLILHSLASMEGALLLTGDLHRVQIVYESSWWKVAFAVYMLLEHPGHHFSQLRQASTTLDTSLSTLLLAHYTPYVGISYICYLICSTCGLPASCMWTT